MPVDAPWTAPNAAEWDRQTLDTWLRANTSGSDEFMAVVSAATEAIFGCEPRELSLLYTLFYIAASGNEQNPGTFERNFNTAGGAQEQPLRRAARSRSRCDGRARSAAASCSNAPVRSIAQTASGVTRGLRRRHRDGAARDRRDPAHARARGSTTTPRCPALRDQLTQHMPQGTLMKFEAIYDTPVLARRRASTARR